jgi:hypothetical protein
MNPRRLLMVLVVVVMVAAVMVLDRSDTTPTQLDTSDPQSALSRLMPTAAPADAGAATWYCAAGTATGTPQGLAEQTVVITNITNVTRTAVVTAYAETGQVESVSVDLPAGTRTPVRVADLVTAGWAGVLVEANGGGVAVDHYLAGPTGATAGPCASSVSGVWFLPAASTVLGVRHLVVLFNPFPDLAVVDLAVQTADGIRTPPEFSGVVVPAMSVRMVDVAALVTVRDHVVITVTTRSGLVVAEQVEASGPDSNLPGSLVTTLGAPAAQPSWYFPLSAPTNPDDGSEFTDQQYVVFNPGTAIAEVDVQLLVNDPATNGFIEPFEATVRPGQFVVVDLADEARVPDGAGFGAYVESRNGVPVVAARVLRASDRAQSGASISIGTPLLATEWVVPLGGMRSGDGAQVGISNMGLRDAEVTVTIISGGSRRVLADANARVVGAGTRLELDLADVDDPGDVSLLIESTQPVAVERGLVFTSGRGFAMATAIALAGTLSRPQTAVPDTSTSPTVVLDGLTTTTTTVPATTTTLTG